MNPAPSKNAGPILAKFADNTRHCIFAGALFVFFHLASSGNDAFAFVDVEQFEAAADIVSDDVVHFTQAAAPETALSFKNYTYQSALKVNVRYSLIYKSNTGQVISEGRSFVAEIKTADEADPSIKLYVPDGPIRFYLPDSNINALPRANWRFRDCTYKIVDTTEDMKYFNGIVSEGAATGLLRFLVESRCDDSPRAAVRYLFDVDTGLLSFTLGDIAEMGNGEQVFQPKDSYFFTFGHYAFGAAGMKSD